MSLPPRAYVLCSNPRSGTTLLCQMLRDVGVGQPDSFFSPRFTGGWAQEWGLPWPTDITDIGFQKRYLAAMIKAGRGQGDVFGLRLMAEDIDEAERLLARCHPGHDRPSSLFDAAFGETRYIHLSRQDKLAEAVSLIRAQQTGLWHRHADGSVLEQYDPSEPLHYDAAVIAEQMQILKDHDAKWLDWFQAANITPLSLTYEGLAANPQGNLARGLAHLGADPTKASDVKPGTAGLSDAVSRDWITWFKRDNAA